MKTSLQPKPKPKRLGPGDDLLMINSPDRWPCWPILPMKNRKNREPRDLGIILDGQPTTILVGCLGLTDWEKAERIRYNSVEELLADGWIVD